MSMISRQMALEVLEFLKAEGVPVLSLSFENRKTTCCYNINLDPANPAPLAAEWLAKNLDAGRLRCPWCGDFAHVDLVSIGDGPSVYPPRPMIYARLTHVGCPVVTETEKINVP